MTFRRRLIVDLKSRPFPDRHALFQFIDNPLAGSKRRGSAPGCNLQKQRSLASADKPDTMTDDNVLELEILCRLFRDQPELMLRHGRGRFIIDPLNPLSIFALSHLA